MHRGERAARAAHVGATAGAWLKVRSSCCALPLALIRKQKCTSSGGSRAEVKRSGTSLEAAGLASDNRDKVLRDHKGHQNRSKTSFFPLSQCGPKGVEQIPHLSHPSKASAIIQRCRFLSLLLLLRCLKRRTCATGCLGQASYWRGRGL